MTQVVGFAYDVYTLDEGAITWNVVSTVFNKFDFLPVVDAITNIYNIGEEFGDSIIYTPIYEPDITYPYPPIPMP